MIIKDHVINQLHEKKKNNDEVDYEILQALKETENRHLSFFKAILPSLNTLNDHQTLMFQSRVLQILTDLHQISYQYETSTGYHTASQDRYQRSQSSYTTNYQPTQTFTYQSTMSSNVSKTPAPSTSCILIYQPSTSSNSKPSNSTFEELSNDCEDEASALESTYDFS